MNKPLHTNTETFQKTGSPSVRKGLLFQLLSMVIGLLLLWGAIQGVYVVNYVVDLFHQESNSIIEQSEKELLSIALEEIAHSKELVFTTETHITRHHRGNIHDFPFELFQGDYDLMREFIVAQGEKVAEKHLSATLILAQQMEKQARKKIQNKINELKQSRLDAGEQLKRSLRRSLLFFTFISILVIVALQSAWIIKKILKPIYGLVEGSCLIEQGQLKHQIVVTGSSELGLLAKSFNNMTTTLLNSHHKLITAKEYTDNIIGSIIDTLIVISPDSHIQMANHSACTLLGYTEKELVDQSITYIFAQEDQTVCDTSLMGHVREKAIKEIDVSYRAKDGAVIPMLLSGVALWHTDGSLQAVVLAAKDMRESKLLKALKNTTVQLEQEIIERRNAEGKAIRARQDAEIANLTKSEFVANMSHEIRTPMNSIIGMTDLALQNDLPPKVKGNLSVVKASSHILLNVIDDILDFSKIEAGKLGIAIQPFKLHDILTNIWKIFNYQAAKKGLSFNLKLENYVQDAFWGDSFRIEQVLVNLIGNSIKFTEKGSVVLAIKTESVPGKQSKTIFSVIDTGIGITTETANKLFNPFTQADTTTTRDFGGTGLGLTICKQLVELMDGEITLSSIAGKGSTFSFSLPLKAPPKKPQQSVQEHIGKKILLVDDNVIATERVKKALTESGFGVETLSLPGGIEEKLYEHNKQGVPFDLIIIANKIYGEDGLIKLEMICNEPLLAATPVIIETDFFSNDFAERWGKNSAVHALLFKPVGIQLCIDTVRSLLGFNSDEKDGVSAIKYNNFSALQDRTILLAEDNTFNQMLAQEVLESCGLHVRIATNGLEAVEMLDKNIDAILMDIQMPVMDGFEATKAIRAQQQFSDIPIIAMTAHAMSGYREKCIQRGMTDYIAKPFQPEDVFAVLSKYILSRDINQQDLYDRRKKQQSCNNTPIDIAAIRQHFQNFYKMNDEQTERVLQSSRKTLAKELKRAEVHLAHDDFELLSKTAHSIKGALLTLDLNRHAGLAERLEKHEFRAGDEVKSTLQQRFVVLKNELASLVTSS